MVERMVQTNREYMAWAILISCNANDVPPDSRNVGKQFAVGIVLWDRQRLFSHTSKQQHKGTGARHASVMVVNANGITSRNLIVRRQPVSP